MSISHDRMHVNVTIDQDEDDQGMCRFNSLTIFLCGIILDINPAVDYNEQSRGLAEGRE